MFKPRFATGTHLHRLTGQAWSQSYSFLDKNLINHFEQRNVSEEDCKVFFQTCMESDRTKYVLLHTGKIFLQKNTTSVLWLNSKDIASIGLKFRELNDISDIGYAPLVFLGTNKEVEEEHYFAIGSDTISQDIILDKFNNGSWINPRNLLVADKTNAAELAIIGQATSRLNWIRRTKFSVATGEPVIPSNLGHRLITESGKKTYPHLSPVAICLVLNKDGSKILLGERRSFAGSGFFSCISGFVEQGENVEDAAKREIFEESGVTVDSEEISILGSQSWPIGSAGGCELMIACVAYADDEEINFSEEEMSRMQWFTKDEVKKMIDNSFTKRRNMWKKNDEYIHDVNNFGVPPTTAIAHNLINTWANEETIKVNNKINMSTSTAVTIGTLVGIIASVLVSSSI